MAVKLSVVQPAGEAAGAGAVATGAGAGCVTTGAGAGAGGATGAGAGGATGAGGLAAGVVAAV